MNAAMTGEPSDEELVGRFQADPLAAPGQEAAAALFRRYREQVYLWCFRRVQDHERALDVAQDVLISAYRALGSFQGRARYSSWLFTIMRHRCYRELGGVGRRWVDERDPDGLPGRDKTPEVLFLEMQDEGRVLELIRTTLEPREQLALWLRCFENVPVDEITRRLQIPGSAGARSVLQSARRKLRAALNGRANARK